MMSVYVATSSGIVALAWNLPVSQITACVAPETDWLSAMVYRAEFVVQEAMMSKAVGVTEREVKFQAKVT